MPLQTFTELKIFRNARGILEALIKAAPSTGLGTKSVCLLHHVIRDWLVFA